MMQGTKAFRLEATKGPHAGAPRAFVPSCLCAFFLLTCIVRADSIFVGNLETKNVTIKELRGDTLLYDVNGRPSEREYSRITRLVILTEAPLTSAEEAFSLEKWDAAVDGYLKTIRSSNKQWVKDWSTRRLLQAAGKSGRFDATASAYIQMLLRDPAAAAKIKPAMPESRSTFLDSAVTEVNTTLRDPKLTVDQKRALIGFLIDLQQARKDVNAENAAYEQLAALPGADANDPNAKRLLARRRLTAAAKAIDSRNFAQAISEIDAGRSIFIEPKSQVEALYLLAQARYGLAGNDSNALKDAGLAYMRVVALGKSQPDRPRVVESLMKTAEVVQRAGDNKAAVSLYEQIIAQYPDDPMVAEARTNLGKLKPN